MNNYKFIQSDLAKTINNEKTGISSGSNKHIFAEIKANIKKIFLYKATCKEISIFCRQMSLLLSAGITVSDSFITIAEELKNKYLKENLNNIALNIEQGAGISMSMEKYKNLFPEFMINMIKIGEESGGLNIIFKNLSEYYIKENQILKKVKNAMAYPCIVFILTICVMSFLLIRIIPAFSETLISLGGELPVITKVVVGLSHFIIKNVIEIIISLFSVFFIFLILIRQDKIKEFLDIVVLKIPYVGKIYLQTFELKFLRSISILVCSGGSLIYSIEMLKNMTGNKELSKRLLICVNEIKEGNSFLKGIKNTKIFDSTIISLIKVGEETGAISEMFIKSADILDEEISGEIEKMTTLIEPIMIISLAVLVGIIILSVILPMMKINDCIGA